MKKELAVLAADLFRQIADGNITLKELSDFINRCNPFEIATITTQPQWMRAREIMGSNYFGPDEAIKYFGVNPTQEQLVALSEIPFSEETLNELKDTHILIADFGTPILEVRRIHGGLFYNQSWYNDEQFVAERGGIDWQLVRKNEAPESFKKNWQEQLEILPETDEVPTARLAIYTAIGHFLNTGERLFKCAYVRTSFMVSVGLRVVVGCFDSGGLDVYYFRVGLRDDDLGVASARKIKP